LARSANRCSASRFRVAGDQSYVLGGTKIRPLLICSEIAADRSWALAFAFLDFGPGPK
jgi:hypothetical protein